LDLDQSGAAAQAGRPLRVLFFLNLGLCVFQASPGAQEWILLHLWSDRLCGCRRVDSVGVPGIVVGGLWGPQADSLFLEVSFLAGWGFLFLFGWDP